MRKTYKIFYWIATILLSLLMLYSALMYVTKTEMIEGFFQSLDYPIYLVFPLAIAKTLGVLMILYRKPLWLMEWAYAGFFFDMALASVAHFKAGDGIGLSAYGIVLLLVSYFCGKKIRSK